MFSFIVLGLGIASLAIGLVVRMIVSFFAVWGTDFNMKERFFIPFAWLPKATVQVRHEPPHSNTCLQTSVGNLPEFHSRSSFVIPTDHRLIIDL